MGLNKLTLIMLGCTLSSVFVLAFQNCSQAKFSSGTQQGAASESNSNHPANGVLTVTGEANGSTLLTISQGSSGAALGHLIVPPAEPFTASTCVNDYPFSSSTPATNVNFNESDVMTAYSPKGSVTLTPDLALNVWYSDEHALTLGIRRVTVNSAAGSTNTDYPITAMNANPGAVLDPQVGSVFLTGDQSGTDTSSCPGVPYICARPMFPALFITDTTGNPTNRSGDWQYGGKPLPPHAVFGTWKAAVRIVDQVKNTVTVTTDPDPARNFGNLGGIPAPADVGSEGYSALVSWRIDRLGLQSGHSYRLQFMVHDGDQNKLGGDAGVNCINIQVP